MTYKLMVVDDSMQRKAVYDAVLATHGIEPVYVWTYRDFQAKCTMPVDGYLLDIFLDDGDWDSRTAASLVEASIRFAPRPAPVFLVSKYWNEPKLLDVLKRAGESSVKVAQYFAWSEFLQATIPGEEGTARLHALRKKFLTELDLWHERSGFRPDPNQTIRILLLADPQFGDQDTSQNATFAENWIAKSLRSDALKPAGAPVPDLIVIAGDVTHSGRPDQFALAEERLAKDLMAPLWGDHNIARMRDRIVVVPGNHDVNLRFAAADGRRFSPGAKEFVADSPIRPGHGAPYSSHTDYALEPFRRFAHRLTGQREWRDRSSLSWVDRRFVHCGIRFFVLNTVEDLNAESPARASFNEETTRAINRSLVDDVPESIFSIAVSHHGLRPDGSRDNEVDNWNEVGAQFFSQHKIRLWLYGHYHSFNRRSFNGMPFDGTPLWGVQAPTTRIYPSTRGFCVIELKRENGVVIDALVHYHVLEEIGTTSKRKTLRVFG